MLVDDEKHFCFGCWEGLIGFRVRIEGLDWLSLLEDWENCWDIIVRCCCWRRGCRNKDLVVMDCACCRNSRDMVRATGGMLRI